MDDSHPDPRLRRWRLVLGQPAEEAFGTELRGEDIGMDRVLQALYETERAGGLGSSSPKVNRWLGDIREYFPSSIVQVMQKDALERLNLRQMLTEPEMLEAVEPDIHLVATLLTLGRVIPKRTKATARKVVGQVVAALMKKLRGPTTSAVQGGLSRAERTRRPRGGDIDWDRTIRKNLHTYQPQAKSIIAERLFGFGRRRRKLRDIVLCVDQSGSMASSVVYASVFGAALASLPAVTTKMVVFDTAVVDLTEELRDPVDLLFGTQLGGGTDIGRALRYCQGLIQRPGQTIMVLITDLYEGGDSEQMFRRVQEIVASGVKIVCLLALSDLGAPGYDARNAQRLSSLGVPAFACTPDLFPDLMAAAIAKADLAMWAARQGIKTAAH